MKENGLISVENVSKKFGEIQALENVSFTINKGDIFGYMGPNGAGKTTTIHIILGLLSPSSGRATVLGHPSEEIIPEVRKRIGVVLEEDGNYNYLSAKQNLNFYGKVYEIPEDKLQTRIDELLRFSGLQDRKDDRVAEYSRGMKRRLALARALLNEPDILICDELTTGLDPNQQKDTQELIEKNADEGTTVFFSSHNLNEVQNICNRVGIINNGRLLFCGTMKEALDKISSELQITCVLATDEDSKQATEIFQSLDIDFEKESPQKVKIRLEDEDFVPKIIQELAKADIKVGEIRKSYQSIERLYHETVREEKNHG